MTFFEFVGLGIENIFIHKLRSSLTILGMVFGSAAVITMLSIGSGAKEETIQQIKSLGSDNLWIKSQKPPERGGNKEEDTENNIPGRTAVVTSGLTSNDARHLKEIIFTAQYIVPLKEVREDVYSAKKKTELRVVATGPDYQIVAGLTLRQGRFISRLDIEQKKKVCVLGFKAGKALFGPFKNPLGETVRIGLEYFRVVGVLRRKPVSSGGQDINQEIYTPLSITVGQFKSSYENKAMMLRDEAEVDEIVLKIKDDSLVEVTARMVRNYLKRSHPRGDYELIVPQELLRQIRRAMRMFNIVMGSIAAISLLVGGIGIMNIMLATVTERTREIGLRRAVGASRRDIIKQFLIETLVLALLGGIIGIGVGIAGAKIIPFLTGGEYKTIVSSYSVLAAFFISLLIGIIFGMYPAYKAAQTSPIEALRYE